MTTAAKKTDSSGLEPVRRLGADGLALWRSAAFLSLTRAALESLQILCEQVDERCALRKIVVRDGLADDRRALRALDAQIDEGLDWLDDEMTRAAAEKESIVNELTRRREARLPAAAIPAAPGRRSQQRRSGSR